MLARYKTFVCICLFVTSRCCTETVKPNKLVFDISFSTYQILLCEEIWVLQRKVFPSGTLSQIPNLEKETFTTARRLSQRVVNLARQWCGQFITLSVHLCLQEDVHERARRAVHLRQLILVSVTFPCSRLSGPSVRPSFLRIVTLLQALKITRVQVVRDRKQATTSEQAAL